MLNDIQTVISDQVKNLVKEITSAQGGQWVSKKELRMNEADKKAAYSFNPKAARTKSF